MLPATLLLVAVVALCVHERVEADWSQALFFATGCAVARLLTTPRGRE
jgi:hypothetical protein